MGGAVGLAERIQQELQRRTYPVGPAVVQPSDLFWGHDTSATFKPAAYGDYIATSAAVYSVIDLRSSLLASLPIKFWRGLGKDREEVLTGSLRDLFAKVNPYWTWHRLLKQTEMSLGLWGEAFWVFDRGAGSRPREIWWVKPTQMRPVPHPTDYIAGFVYEPALGGPTLTFAPDEVLWLRYPNPVDEYAGLSPLAAARLAADLEAGAFKSNRNLFTQGLQIGGVVAPDGDMTWSVEQAEALESLLDRRFKGVDKAHKWAVFRSAAKLNPVGVSPKDAEFLGTLDASLDTVARVYGVPSELLNASKRTYENFPTALRAIWELTLVPEANFIATEITEQVVPMFAGQADYAEFDPSTIRALRDDQDKLWERVLRAWESGLIGEKTAHMFLGIEWDAADRRRLQQAFDLIPMGDRPPLAVKAEEPASNGKIPVAP